MTGLRQPVLVVGTGLIGTSLALALRRTGVEVRLADRDLAAVAVATGRGAGIPWDQGRSEEGEPGLVVVAVPPAVTAQVVAEQLRRHPGAVVTDVASVKVPVQRDLAAAGADLTRYVGGHPMAGREVSGPAAARADLLEDRPWVLTPHPAASERAIRAVRALALAVGALPVTMSAGEHDRAVAVVSHAPQVLSSLLAARLIDSSETTVSIAGQGLRDMTRIAASDPDLWVDILAANAAPVSDVLSAVREDLDAMVRALDAIDRGGQDAVAEALRRGNAGRGRVPGKHGAHMEPTTEVPVVIPDEPGVLGRLFADVAEAGFSVEDVRIEHVLGRPTGVVEISVTVVAAEPLGAALRSAGWIVRA